MATIPKPGSQGLGMIHFSPDDRYVTFLGNENSAALTRQLYAYDRETGATKQVIGGGIQEEAKLSKEEQLRRERARIMSTGVTEYSWAKKCDRILVPKDGGLLVQDGVGEGSEGTLRRLFDPADAKWAAIGSGPLLDAKLSDDGSMAFFVWGDEVCACAVPPASDGADMAVPRRLTHGARGEGSTNGLADYCAQEEMDRYTGYWPSPGGASHVAFEAVDESHIPEFTIMNQGVDAPHEQTEKHRYPFAGAANPKVRLGVVPAAAADGAADGDPAPPVWFDLSLPFGDDFYLARVQWIAAGTSAEDAASSVLLAQVQSRDQRSLAIMRLDPATGDATTLWTETSDKWVNLHDVLAPLKGGKELLWASERSGWRHLYVHSATDGTCLRQLTSGDWPVEEMLAVDAADAAADGAAAAPLIYFMGNPASTGDEAMAAGSYTEKHLFRIRSDGSDAKPELLTRTAGVHGGLALSHDRSCFVDQYSTATEPVQASLTSLPSAAEATSSASAEYRVAAEPLAVEALLHSARAADPRVESLASVLLAPRFVSFPSTDGKVSLRACLYEPEPAVHGPGPYPCVVSCYGGPHVQFVSNTWGMATADLRAQFLRAQGFLVVKVDNRGADRRGLAFESAIIGDLGNLEVDDQVAAVRHVESLGKCDPSRVGIMGWSYGGYLSAMCLARAPEVFRCAVAGAPVTSWDGYDTHYTERYMGGTPESAPAAYDVTSVMHHVDKIEGALLLVHGLMDENVHFRHTARLTQAMVEAQKSYELLCFPKERHSPRSLKDRTFMEQSVFAFLQRWLG